LSSELYAAQNTQGQYVFTWYATNNTATFTGDITPFFSALSTYKGAPTSDSYLGYVAFGSEIFYATGGNMTFSVPKMSLSINGK
jgi:hypothetical protein